MSISKKIIKEVNRVEKDDNFKKLMLNILEEEANGLHNFRAKYDEYLKKYINENIVEVIRNDSNRKN